MRKIRSSLAMVLGVGVVGAMVIAAPAWAQNTQNTLVVITGGADESQHHYVWNVTNRSELRIVRVEFPHYAADLFSGPSNDWKQGSPKEMNLVNLGWNRKPGVCWAEVKPGNPGIAPGATATFTMRISSVGALVAPGTVTVKFDDGTKADIPGVQLPTEPPKTSAWLAPVSIGAIFVLFIVYHEYSKRKQPKKSVSLDDADNDE